MAVSVNAALKNLKTYAFDDISQAVKIEHDTLSDGAKYAVGDIYNVNEGCIYDISSYIRSKNATAQTDIRIDAEVYNTLNIKIADIAGKYYRLNSGSQLSERIKSVNRPLMPAGAAYVKLYAYLTQGKATAYIDGISVYNAEENNEITVEKFNFSATESGWQFSDTGSSTISDISEGKKMNVSAGTAKLSRKITTLHADVKYTIITNYSSTAIFDACICFYDIQGKIIEGSLMTTSGVPNTVNNTVALNFIAPSHYYAILYYDIKSAGELTLSETIIRENGNGNVIRQAAQWNLRGVGEITTEDSISGYSVKMNVTDGSSTPYVLCSNAVRLIQGKNYTLSYYVKAKNTSAFSFRAFLDLSNSGDGWVNYAGGGVNGDCEWEKREYEFQVSKTSQLNAIGFQVLGGSGIVYIDEVKISCGDTASIFAPAEVSVSSVRHFEVDAGESKEFSSTLTLSNEIKRNFTPRAKIKQDGKIISTVSLDFSKSVTELTVGDNAVSITFNVPAFLKKDTYKLCLSPAQFNSLSDIVIAEFTVTNENVTALPNCEVKIINGAPAIVIDGKPQSAILYQKPYGTGFLQDGDENIFESGINLYVTYKGGLAVNSTLKNKGGVGMNDDMWNADGSLDFAALDSEINATLSADSNAMVMVNIGVFAPEWWLDINETEKSVVSDSSGNFTAINDASFASEKFINEAGSALRLIIEHMVEQPYYNRIFGIKLSAGRTYEWMSYGEGGVYCDYSTAALNGFRKYLMTKYANVSNLRLAWGDSAVTFDTATIPTMVERGESSLGMLVSEQNVVDYNTYVGYASANALISYAKIVKEIIPNNLIVGAYNGYLWFSNGHDGLTSSHTSLKTVLDSDYIDFIASPANYNEKILGRASGVMSVADTVRAYGKLYIIEEDNRTSYSQGYSNVAWNATEINSIGRTYSVTDTINQAKRNAVYNFVNGNGQWYFDMEGGWFDDEQLYSFINEMKAETDYSLKKYKNLNNEVAVFVPDNLYSYAAVNNGNSNPYYLYQYLYRAQRKNLEATGAGYDIYSISSLTGNLPEYKVNIMLAPISLTDEERNAINLKLKKDGKYIVWVYLTDYLKNGSATVNQMSEMIGMTVKTDTVSGKKFAVKFAGNNSLVSGLTDIYYGSSGIVKTTLPYVSDSGATTLGYLADYTSLLSKRVGLAYKDNGTYKSIFSSAPNLPESFLRRIYAAAGVKVYSSDPNDVIWTNSSYIALHSAFSGIKTINLNGNYSVYDVFSKSYISMNTSVITYNHIGDETKLFRLSEPENEISNSDVTEKNIIASGAFDNGKTGEELQPDTTAWGVNTVVNGEEAYSGYSLKVSATDAAGGTMFNYGAGNVMAGKIKANTPYRLSYMIKVTGAQSGFKVCPYFQPNGGTSVGRLIFGTDDRSSTYKLDIAADTDWICQTAYCVTGEDVSAPRIGFRYKGTGTIYIDNVTLVEDDNYLVDGNMETTETWNGATISEEGGYFGKGIVSTGTAQSDSKNYFVATSALVTGETYIVTAKVKIADKGSGCNVSLRIYNFADGSKQTEITNGNTRAIFTDNTDGWATAKVEFVAGEQAAPRWHRIQFVCNGVNTTYIDEVRIIKKSTNTEVPSSEILSEGFEGETLNAAIDGDKGNDALGFGYGVYGKNAQIDHFASSGAKKYSFALDKDITLSKNEEKFNLLKVKFAFNAGAGVKLGARLVNGSNVISEVAIGNYVCGSGWVDANVNFVIPEDAPATAKLQVICDFAAADTTLKLDNFYAEGVMPASINVTFDGGNSQTVKEGGKVTKPTDPVKVGYEFKGWYKGNELYDFDTVITADDESFDLTSKFELDLIDLSKENLTAEGLKLADGEQTYKTAKNSDGNVETLYVNKSAAEDVAVKFVKEKQITGITFDYLIVGSSTESAVNYIGKDGTTKTAQTATINADGAWHMVTLGASDDFSAFEVSLKGFEGEMLIANVNVTLKTYNVRFVDDEGAALSEVITVINGETVAEDKIPAAEKAGYEFLGWKAAGEAFTKDTVITKDLTVSAQYVRLYTVTIVIADGTPNKTFTVKDGESFELSSIADIVPEKAADGKNTYAFKGWAIGETEINEKVIITGDTTIIPVFTATAINSGSSGCAGSIGMGSIAGVILALGAVLVCKKKRD